MDDSYDASESASQQSDLDVEGPSHSPHGNLLSPRQRGQVADSDTQTPKGRPRVATTDSGRTSRDRTGVVPHVTFDSPEFPPPGRRRQGTCGRQVTRHVPSDHEEECVALSPLCVLHVSGYQESDVDQSETDVPSTMENIAMEVGQNSVVSDTESGVSPGEKVACLQNIHSVLKRPLRP